jgi:hypothetical protein
MRFWNMGDKPVSSEISLNTPVLKAVYSSHVETDIQEIPVKENTITIDLNQKELKTYRVITSNK